ncbi:methyl-accepting chemotaxis protein [uncultured Brachyspira sp.]|uniref:methyl-accepting chemotaxis protein n=1 Tax=uncultured Brachyspira sp. TaxID=221953 RepID=UPI0025D0C301|nr:methyl-accepting chemotaxis protein [uncultured Brachyspira sp.]
MFKKLSLQVKISLAILLPLLIMILISNIVNIIYVQGINQKLSYKILQETARGEGSQLSTVVKEDLYLITGLKYTLENMYNLGNRNRKYYEDAVKLFFNILPETAVGCMIAFEPDILGNDINYIDDYPLNKGRQTYYISRYFDNSIHERELTSEDISSEYYTEPIRKQKEHLSGVYSFNLGNNNLVKMYAWSVPIMHQNKPIAVITAYIKIETLNETMKLIKPFQKSEGLLFDHNGNILYDENAGNISKNIYSIYPKYKEHQVLENVSKGNTASFTDYTEYYKENATYFFTPIEMAEGKYWILELMVANSSIFGYSNAARNTMIIISLLIMIVASIMIPYTIRAKVTKIIGYIARDITKISEGDISFKISRKFLNMNDEWGDIGNGLENTLSSLNKVVSSVKNSAEHVSSAANQVLAGNNDLSVRTESQASSLEETAASMNEMSSSIKESANGVELGASMVSEAKEYLNKAGIIVEDGVNRMNDVHEASTKIMDITKLIENIAFQTNILALNASVEAARAGEQGRGFAVVASEVRNLAQNTQESVKSITSLISDSNEKTNLASQSVKETKEIFGNIFVKMDNASNIMDKINTASQEQQRGIEQVNSAITNMDSSVQKNASLVEEAASSSQSLFDEANKLIKVIEYFKLRN